MCTCFNALDSSDTSETQPQLITTIRSRTPFPLAKFSLVDITTSRLRLCHAYHTLQQHVLPDSSDTSETLSRLITTVCSSHLLNSLWLHVSCLSTETEVDGQAKITSQKTFTSCQRGYTGRGQESRTKSIQRGTLCKVSVIPFVTRHSFSNDPFVVLRHKEEIKERRRAKR